MHGKKQLSQAHFHYALHVIISTININLVIFSYFPTIIPEKRRSTGVFPFVYYSDPIFTSSSEGMTGQKITRLMCGKLLYTAVNSECDALKIQLDSITPKAEIMFYARREGFPAVSVPPSPTIRYTLIHHR